MTRAGHMLPAWLRLAIRDVIEGNSLVRRIHLKAIAAELDLIEAELAAMNGPWHGFTTVAAGASMTERVVEVPWVLSRYAGERRVLEIGPTFAYTTYIQHLNRLGIEELHGLDLSTRPVRGLSLVQGDVRDMPYPDLYFDLIHCVSTIEHVGLDVSRYRVDGVIASDSGDVIALREMRRVLTDNGRILITVPFGRIENLDWMRQYDMQTWQCLIDDAGVRSAETEMYGYSPVNGWALCEPPMVPEGGYREWGAPGATGVLCASLIKKLPL